MHALSTAKTDVLKAALVAVSVVVAVAVAVAVLSQQQGARAQDASAGAFYTVTDLGTLGGDFSRAHDINEAGHIVGISAINVSETSPTHAFLYDPGATPKMTDLGTLGGHDSFARAINESDQVVGESDMPQSGEHAFLYDKSASPKMSDLGTLSGGHRSEAYGVNDAGQVVGNSNSSSFDTHAFLYDESASPQMTDLGTLRMSSDESDGSKADSINNAGKIVGWSDNNTSSYSHAFLYDKSASPKMTDLGTLGGPSSLAHSINETGQVVGSSSTGRRDDGHPVDYRAFLYDANASPKMRDLGTLLGDNESEASDINDVGQVVGYSLTSSGAGHAFLYSSGCQMVDLNSLIPPGSGWTLDVATAINDKGQIVGRGFHNGHQRAFLLTPKGTMITGTSAPETLTGTPARDYICGGMGADTIKGLGGNDTIKGEAGADKLYGGTGNDTLDGGTGTDYVNFSESSAPVMASLTTNNATGEGADTLVAVENFAGSRFDDTLDGSSANNFISGRDGADVLNGLEGSDELAGGGGGDTENGGLGNDTVVGSAGADDLNGDGGDDTVDSKDGVNGNDTLDGGAGTDTKITDATERSIVGFP